MTIESAFSHFMEANPAHYQTGIASDNATRTISFSFQTEKGAFDTICFFLESEGVLMVASKLNLKIDPENPEEVARVIKGMNDINSRSTLGHFYWDEMVKQGFAKLSQIVRGDESTMADTIRDTVLMCGVMARDVAAMLN